MSDRPNDNDPSMDDILSSIRRIIAEEDDTNDITEARKTAEDAISVTEPAPFQSSSSVNESLDTLRDMFGENLNQTAEKEPSSDNHIDWQALDEIIDKDEKSYETVKESIDASLDTAVKSVFPAEDTPIDDAPLNNISDSTNQSSAPDVLDEIAKAVMDDNIANEQKFEDDDVLELTDMVSDTGEVIEIEQIEPDTTEVTPEGENSGVLVGQANHGALTVQEAPELPATTAPDAITAAAAAAKKAIKNSSVTDATRSVKSLIRNAVAGDYGNQAVNKVDTESAIVSDATENAAAAALAALSDPTGDDARRIFAKVWVSENLDQATIEGIARSVLKPMMKDWLDANLSNVVERVVRQEIERIVEKSTR